LEEAHHITSIINQNEPGFRYLLTQKKLQGAISFVMIHPQEDDKSF